MEAEVSPRGEGFFLRLVFDSSLQACSGGRWKGELSERVPPSCSLQGFVWGGELGRWTWELVVGVEAGASALYAEGLETGFWDRGTALAVGDVCWQ